MFSGKVRVYKGCAIYTTKIDGITYHCEFSPQKLASEGHHFAYIAEIDGPNGYELSDCWVWGEDRKYPQGGEKDPYNNN